VVGIFRQSIDYRKDFFMPNILYPSEVILTEGTKLDLGWLIQGTRVPVVYTLTVGTAAVAGDTQLLITSNVDNVLIQAGTKLVYGSETIVANADALIDQTVPTPLLLNKPLVGAIAAAATTTTKALLTVLGLKEASPQGQTQTVDVSNFLSGFGQENVVTGINRTLTCSGFVIKGDRATDRIIKQLILNDEKARREVYAELNLPSGERYEGAAKIENYNTTTNVRNVQEFSFSLMFQGASFAHTPATIYTPVAQDL
jgi:Phage tail tube protein